MRAEIEIKSAGMKALVGALGEVEAERFVTLVQREQFNYTEWRQTNLPELNIGQLHSMAMTQSLTR
jgi:hypothetical protein